LLVGCGQARNTLAQDLAWERWQQCKGSAVQLKEIRPDGRIWVTYSSYDGYREVDTCLRRAAKEQAAKHNIPPSAVANVFFGMAEELGPEAWGAPVWKKGYEWAYRWESPRGKGTFVWSVDRQETIGGTDYYVINAGNEETYWRKSDLAYYMYKVEGEI